MDSKIVNDGIAGNNDPLLTSGRVILLLLDGLAVGPSWSQGVLGESNMPFLASLFRDYPGALLNTEFDNRNVRYLNIGSGRRIDSESYQPVLTLSSYLSSQDKTQLKIVETERLAALTHFFNGGREEKEKGETWEVISSDSSPAEAETAQAFKRTVKEIIKSLKSKDAPDFICSVLPVLDLASLEGKFDSVKGAAAMLDKNLRLICNTASANSVTVVISSAGGGAENIDQENSESILTKGSLNPVPFIVVGPEYKGRSLGIEDSLEIDLALSRPAGRLSDIAPTLLSIMGLPCPKDMDGDSLWKV